MKLAVGWYLKTDLTVGAFVVIVLGNKVPFESVMTDRCRSTPTSGKLLYHFLRLAGRHNVLSVPKIQSFGSPDTEFIGLYPVPIPQESDPI